MRFANQQVVKGNRCKSNRCGAWGYGAFPTHAHYALQFLEAGCHVLMEKLIATNIEDAEKFVAMARA